MEPKQLFRLVRDVSIPEPVALSPTGDCITSETVMPAAMAICWPDGRPCCVMEMYLLDQQFQHTTRRLDGGSLRVRAGQLSQLLRYAYGAKVQLWEFDDMHMHAAIRQIAEAPSLRYPGEHRRDNNTIRKIIAAWISFFAWLQVRLACETPIVGTEDSAPRIPLKYKEGGRRGGYLTYRYAPPAVAHQDVRGPIGREIRLKLWEAVARMAREPSTQVHQFKSQRIHDDGQIIADYMRKRRELVLELLEATGARPGELARLSVEKNRRALTQSRLVLSTLKRHTVVDPERCIPIDRAVAMRVEIFVGKYRANLLRVLREAGLPAKRGDCLLLTLRGTPLTEAAIERDFSRLVQAADLQDEKACMSMFRHRFITNMVKLHLLEFMKENPHKAGRSFMTDGDYRTILGRVKAFTGHADEGSLLGYIDLAWDELGMFSHVEPAMALISAIEGGLDHIAEMAIRLRPRKAAQANEVLQEVIALLDQVRNQTLEALKAMKPKETSTA